MSLFETRFISAGGNRHPSAADWDSETGILAFGSGQNIAIWRPLNNDNFGIELLLVGHTDAVNAVKFLPGHYRGSKILLSGSSDNTLKIWSCDVANPKGQFQLLCTLSEHERSINTIAVVFDGTLFATAAADATIKIWRLSGGQDEQRPTASLIQTISISPKYFPLALSFSMLDNSESMILAVGGTKSIIQIYVGDGENLEFRLSATLTGHEGWIRSLDFSKDKQDILLASASQDKYIRLWRVHEGRDLPTAIATGDPSLGSVGKSLSNKAHRFSTKHADYSITFEALLLGHEDWIYTARWSIFEEKLALLSASADNSLAIWQLDELSGVWVCNVRLGEISAQKGATTATGSTGGFWIGLWSPDSNAVVSLGRTGSWRLWKRNPHDDRWLQDIAVSGHIKEVQDIAWAKDGSYLLSTSSDQTTRMFSEWIHDGIVTWHEISRPQIHGYDLNCIDSVTNDRFISGADEKLLRVFDKPHALAKIHLGLRGQEVQAITSLPDVASIPVLGLSNKAGEGVEFSGLHGEAEQNGTDDVDSTKAKQGKELGIGVDHPPTEDQLSRHLLWPEIEKLYGHGYEISCVAASHDGTLVATACRASSLDHAVIRIYNTETWREQKPPLAAHTLTVTGLQFSPSNKYLLSVGRDRQCCVFHRDSGTSASYEQLSLNTKAHTRMILDASWAPTDKGIFATAGRDKCVHIWELLQASFERRATLSLDSAVTTVSFMPRPLSTCLLLACGTETGAVVLFRLDGETLQIKGNVYHHVKDSSPSISISRLAWRPSFMEGTISKKFDLTGFSRDQHTLAIASEDCSVRIVDVRVLEDE